MWECKQRGCFDRLEAEVLGSADGELLTMCFYTANQGEVVRDIMEYATAVLGRVRGRCGQLDITGLKSARDDTESIE